MVARDVFVGALRSRAGLNCSRTFDGPLSLSVCVCVCVCINKLIYYKNDKLITLLRIEIVLEMHSLTYFIHTSNDIDVS